MRFWEMLGKFKKNFEKVLQKILRSRWNGENCKRIWKLYWEIVKQIISESGDFENIFRISESK